MVKDTKSEKTLLNKEDSDSKSANTTDTPSPKPRTLNVEVNERLWVYYTVFCLIGLVIVIFIFNSYYILRD